MIKSKKLSNIKNLKHGFFNSKGGISKNIYKSLNCGPGSRDKPGNVRKNLELVRKKINHSAGDIFLLNQVARESSGTASKLPVTCYLFDQLAPIAAPHRPGPRSLCVAPTRPPVCLAARLPATALAARRRRPPPRLPQDADAAS